MTDKDCNECGGDGYYFEEDRNSDYGTRKVACEACHEEDDPTPEEDDPTPEEDDPTPEVYTQ